MFSLYKLEIFSHVAKVGSFSKAAQALLMTQSGVSQHVQDLERTLGTSLFIRGGRGVTLSPAGETLLEYANKITHLAHEAEQRIIEQAQYQRQLRLGVTPGVSNYLLPSCAQQFAEVLPNATLSVVTDTTPALVAQVLQNRLDLAILEGELKTLRGVDKLSITPIVEVPQVVVIGPKHTWWQRQYITLSDLNKQAMVMRQPHSHTRLWIEHIFAAQSIQPHIIAEFDNPESIKRAVMAGTACTILPIYAVQVEIERGLLHRLDVTDARLLRTLHLAQSSSVDQAMAAIFVQCLAKLCAVLSTGEDNN
jgi:DNA-binding transcriptional LysR family regulator